MEYRIIRTQITSNSWGRWCVSCNHKFEDGEDRHEWRMSLISQNKYHAGSYWNTHCNECFVKNITAWRDTLNEALEKMPTCLRELV